MWYEDGCSFLLKWEKIRIHSKGINDFEAKIETDMNGKATWTIREIEEARLYRVLDLRKNEKWTYGDIAEELQVNKSTVARDVERLIDMELLDYSDKERQKR